MITLYNYDIVLLILYSYKILPSKKLDLIFYRPPGKNLFNGCSKFSLRWGRVWVLGGGCFFDWLGGGASPTSPPLVPEYGLKRR